MTLGSFTGTPVAFFGAQEHFHECRNHYGNSGVFEEPINIFMNPATVFINPEGTLLGTQELYSELRNLSGTQYGTS